MTKSGRKFPVEISARLLKIEDKNYYQSIIRDITERKVFEQNITKQNRVYSILSNINQAIVRTRDRDKLLSDVCKIAVEDGLMKMAWIGIVDKQLNIVKPVSCNGYVEGYLDKIKITLNDEVTGFGPTARAIKSGKYFICNDIEESEYMRPWRDEAIKREYRSSIALPLIVENNVIGSFNLYSDEKDFFDEDEIKLLKELSEDLYFEL
jgi:GAF domain-containing protein